MDRPVMNPSVLLEMDAPEARPSRLRWIQAAGRLLWRGMVFDPFLTLRNATTEPGESLGERFLRGMVYRLALLPVVLAAVASVFVFMATHPAIHPPTADPRSVGLYYDPVSFVGSGGTRVEAWLVPALDARRVIAKSETGRTANGAVVLAHDAGMTREQMLPYLRPLHEAGYTTLVLDLRSEDSSMPLGQTFGLLESKELRAAVEFLRSRPNVDHARIALLGVGTGASAALLAAGQDRSIGAVVVDHPLMGAEEAMDRLTPARWYLLWTRPICKVVFDFAYDVDVDDIPNCRGSPAVLLLDNTPTLPGKIRRMVEFLSRRVSFGR